MVKLVKQKCLSATHGPWNPEHRKWEKGNLPEQTSKKIKGFVSLNIEKQNLISKKFYGKPLIQGQR